ADGTVPGKAAKYSIPTHSSSPNSGRNTGCKDRIKTGNKKKVQANTKICKRQCIMPAIITRPDRFAAIKENRKAMAKVLSHLKKTAPAPWAGTKVAANTTAIKIKVKLSKSMRKRNIASSTK